MAFYPDIDRWEYVVLDTETEGLRWWKDKVFSVSIVSPDNDGFYFDLRTDPGARRWLADKVPKCKEVVCHGVKFDTHMSREAGITIPTDRIFCTMIAGALLNEHELEFSLDYLTKKYTQVRKRTSIYEELAKIFGGKPTAHSQAPNFPKAPIALMSEYAIDDGIGANELYKYQKAELAKQGLEKVMSLEMRLLPVIVEMERGGVRIDVEEAESASAVIGEQVKIQQRALNKEAGFEVNPNPSNSIKQLFKPAKNDKDQWVLVDGTVCESTGASAASIDADCLRRMKHPAASMILNLRKLIKTKGTFLDGHILGHHNNGFIHCNINQTKSDNDLGTGTGRFSINDPALQQIHKRDVSIASVVRSVFKPDYGQDWLSIDWSQFEQRWFAHYVNAADVIKRYRNDPKTDFYQVMSDLTGLPRSARYAGEPNSKTLTLASIFGMGPGKLAQEMGLPYETRQGHGGKVWLEAGQQAKDVLEQFHGNVPGIKDFLNNASSVAKSRGYVRTGMGRHIRFPNGHYTHKAGGLILQGTAADAMKLKLIAVHDLIKSDSGARLMLTVHDEINLSIPPNSEQLTARISECYNDFHSDTAPLKCRVPITSSAGVSGNWWDSCKD